MSNRTAWPGQATTGATHTAAHDNDLPGGWIGYVEVTSAQTGITTETDLTGLSQAVTVNTSRRIRITGYLPAVAASSGSGNRSTLRIKEGATTLNFSSLGHTQSGSEGPAVAIWVGTPSSGAHTYKLSLTATDAGNTNQNAGALQPAFLLIEDIGPA